MSEIVNRVKESGLITLDLADYKSTLKINSIDIADQLWQGLVLKEKDFRNWIKLHSWDMYSGEAIYITCSVDAIIPTWAYMLISSKLTEFGVPNIVGNEEDLEKKLFDQKINEENLDLYQDGRIIIKGCSDVASPEYMMTELVRKLQPVAKSIMYGEPCSTVPVFKRKSS